MDVNFWKEVSLKNVTTDLYFKPKKVNFSDKSFFDAVNFKW